eukprot:sb/3467874/
MSPINPPTRAPKPVRRDRESVWRRHTPFDSQIVRSDRVGGARQMIRGYSVWICQSIGLTHFSLLSKRENCSQSIGLTGLDSKMILCTSAATPSESNGGYGNPFTQPNSLQFGLEFVKGSLTVTRAYNWPDNELELLHYVIIMRCFPATNGFKIDELASKTGFPDEFCAQKQFFAVAMLVTKVTILVAMVTKAVAMVTKPASMHGCSAPKVISASKLDFLMNFVLKKQFFAVAMLVTKVTILVAMVTKAVAMVTKPASMETKTVALSVTDGRTLLVNYTIC